MPPPPRFISITLQSSCPLQYRVYYHINTARANRTCPFTLRSGHTFCSWIHQKPGLLFVGRCRNRPLLIGVIFPFPSISMPICMDKEIENGCRGVIEGILLTIRLLLERRIFIFYWNGVYATLSESNNNTYKNSNNNNNNNNNRKEQDIE